MSKRKRKQAAGVAEPAATYTAAPARIGAAIDAAERVVDFLPPPADLVARQDTVKVTLNLSRRSVDFLKRESHNQGVPYQKMVRRILDLYTERYE